MRLYTHTDSLKNIKGITLVALVVTIGVLLILEGVSINLVLGQNGLIANAKDAANATNKSSLKEKLNMMLADYEIQKITNSNITFKEYVENNKQKNEIENFNIIDESPSEDVKFIGSIEGKLIIMKTDGSYVLTKSDNLVRNGFGKDENENFTEYINNNGVFSITKDQRYGFLDSDLIPIDVNKKYYESVILKGNNLNNEVLWGFCEYDIDKKQIVSENYMYKKDSLTYLAKDLNDGDTEIYLNDVSGFSKSNINSDNNGIILWNYKDSTGYEYPELTYSRNIYRNLFTDENNFDLNNNKIILNEPWNYGKVEKGTKLSQKGNGSKFNYCTCCGNITTEFKLYDCKIDGIKSKGTSEFTKFCSAAKYIKIWMGFNFSDIPNTTTEVKDIIFAECE